MSLTRGGTTIGARAGQGLLAAWIALAAGGAVMCGEPTARVPAPEPRMQAAIEETVSAIARQDAAAPDRIASLQRLASGRRETLLLQLALYLESSDGAERSMAGALLLRQLAFTPREIVETVVPSLEGARPALRRVLAEMLGTIDRREGGEADFRVYESWLKGRGGAPPAALVGYLYEAAPDEALACMRRVYGGGAQTRPEAERAIGELKAMVAARDASRAWSARERDRAAAALETLSRDPAWWVRRYAATILGVVREAATPSVVRRLKDDSDPLVREAMAP